MRKLIIMVLLVLVAGGSAIASKSRPGLFKNRAKRDNRGEMLWLALREKDRKTVSVLVREIGPGLSRKEWDYALVRASAQGWMDILDELIRLHQLYPDRFSLDVSADELSDAPLYFAYKSKRPDVVFRLLPILIREGKMPFLDLKKYIKWFDDVLPGGLDTSVLKDWKRFACTRYQEELKRREMNRNWVKEWAEEQAEFEQLIGVKEKERFSFGESARSEPVRRKRFREELKKVCVFLSDEVERRGKKMLETLQERLKKWKENFGKNREKQQKEQEIFLEMFD